MARLGVPLALLLPLSLLAVGPARAGGFKCPEAGGPPWRELRTAHFVVRTDLASGKAKDLAEELERIHETIRYGLFSKPPDTGVIRVLALADEEEFDLFAPKNASAFYAEPSLSGPTIVLHGLGADAMRFTVAHEITHHVAARIFARQPRWFSEGLACLMESVATVGTPRVGGVPRHWYREVNPYFGSVATVLRAREALKTARDYGVAWALTHYLLNERHQEFGQLMQRFARGQEPTVAWREIFPQWNPASDEAMAALDKEVGRYVTQVVPRGKLRYRDVKLPPAQSPSEQAMTAAEAHDVRLSLPWTNRGEQVDAGMREAEVQEALRHDPGSISALSLVRPGTPAERVALAERATSAHPDDARAWLLLAGALPREATERREAALRKAVAADPWYALALNDLAWHLLETGRADEALPAARKAVELSPGSAPILDTLAGVAEARGDCAAALQIQRRAMDLLPEQLSEKRRVPYRGRLERLEKRCGDPGVQPAAGPVPAAR